VGEREALVIRLQISACCWRGLWERTVVRVGIFVSTDSLAFFREGKGLCAGSVDVDSVVACLVIAIAAAGFVVCEILEESWWYWVVLTDGSHCKLIIWKSA
jgi:hypothetical protein